ncbi:MAG: mannitol dehydrogenase family protein [Xanthomonadales bacterium]|nr:mannitol dehydrogenase family protein [Xanthomonadales bacterium]
MTGRPARGDDLPRLDASRLRALPARVGRPDYDLASVRIGIVHLGAGAFHRAHQAPCIDRLLASEPDWAICAVSLHSTEVREALRPQDGLYTLTLQAEPPQWRIVGAIREVLCAADEGAAVLARLADPQVRIVTLTVTEKGYCLSGGELDLDHPDIRHDLAEAAQPRSVIGWLIAGLRLRRERGLGAYTVASCDNLANNGRLLEAACLRFAQELDPNLASWIEREASFPCSMVDSITPVTDAALRQRVDDVLGLHDAWPVQREPFTQWVVEDRFCQGRPNLAAAGVTYSDDIAGFDRAKLRLLNGAHSTLAYLGSLLELDSVADAMAHPPLPQFVDRLMRQDIQPSLRPPAGLDVGDYITAIQSRFRNPAIRHRLAQIAWDGTQKLPVRLLGTVADALTAGRPLQRLCLAVAGWMHFVRRQAQAGVALVDPMAHELKALGQVCSGKSQADVPRLLSLSGVYGALARDPRFVSALQQAYGALGDGSAADVAAALLAEAEG